MVTLTGKNLGERQRDLNAKVAEAVAKKEKLDEIIKDVEATDIDKLYEIDIASQYKDVYHILEILKCGDPLYISRALRCLWLYKDNYSNVINPENLQENLFPYTSLRIKKKILSTLSLYIRNEDRSICFYIYCNKIKMPEIGYKFLSNTSEEFKLQEIKKGGLKICTYLNEEKTMKHFVKDSFELAKTILNIDSFDKIQTLYNLRFLYSISNKKYLDIIEQYADKFKIPSYFRKFKRFGLRISKDFMVNHKRRVLEMPIPYVTILNQHVFVKYSTIDDAKKCLKGLMPPTEEEFWNDFGNTYRYIIDIIPENERFNYVKQLFHLNYPNETFEMNIQFYHLEYYKMLSVEEKELWALRHIEEQKELLGIGNDYIWYKFVNFDKALVEIKKYVMITPDAHKRLDILSTLVESAKDQKDLTNLLKYYYDRHVNEIEYHKKQFVDEVLRVHNIFKYDLECWEALNKIFYSLEVYTDNNYSCGSFVAVAVFCRILHKQDMPQAIIDFIDQHTNYYHFCSLMDKLSEEQSELILQYLVDIFVNKLQIFSENPYNEELRDELRLYVCNITSLFNIFGKSEANYPDIVKKFLDIDSPKNLKITVTTEKDLYRFLKTDVTLMMDALSQFEINMQNFPERSNKLLRKLKIYFSNDISKSYMNFFDGCLSKKLSDIRLINAIVHGIFQLADETYKIKFLEKYCPSDPKIDHKNMDRQILYIQEAICRLVGYSRPPVPLENVLQYLKGDYIQYCLPLFNMYVVNLPLPLAIKFTEATLNAPLSVQKHGLRAAFKCFSLNDIKNVVGKVWNSTKNVSFRMVMYKLVFDKILDEVDNEQIDVIYEELKHFTSVLHEDDHDDIFDLISSGRMSDKFLGDLLRTAWDMIKKLPEKPNNIKRQIDIINSMEHNIDLVQRDFVRKRIIEEHVDEILGKRKLHPHELVEINELYKAKWNITAKFVSLYETIDELEDRLGLVSKIFKKCFEMWNEICDNKLVYREFCFEFIRNIRFQNARHRYENYWAYNVPVLQHILDLLLKSLPLREIYLTEWEIQLTICARIISSDGNTVIYDRGENFNYLSPDEISKAFANQVGILLKERLERQQFYASFIVNMADTLNATVAEIQNILEHGDNFNILFCQSLLTLGIKEAHLFALMILPAFVNDDIQECLTSILRKIQAFDDEEVQTLLYSKFLLDDYINRF